MLVVQYGTVLWFVRKSGRGAVLPVALTMLVLFSTGITFTALIFSFNSNGDNHSFLALYVVVLSTLASTVLISLSYIVSAIEAILVVAISCVYRTVSFRSTNLVERVGLLTLIILGEGVIGVIRAIATTLINTWNVTNTMVAIGFAALIVLVMDFRLFSPETNSD